MNLVTRYKKTALLATVVAAISMSSVRAGSCGPCAAAAAIRQSIKDAQAAALAGGKKSLEQELDQIDVDADESADRAAREELADPCNPFATSNACDDKCSLNCKLQTLYNCCVATNKEVCHQAHEARKCCKRLHHELEEIEDQTAACCSVTDANFSVIESLIVSQSDASAACCSVMEGQIVALNASVAAVFAVLLSVFDCTCT